MHSKRTLPACCLFVLLATTATVLAEDAPQPKGYTIPTLDLSADTGRQVVVDREAGQYLGHPTTVLLEDGKTILCVYPKGHGRGAIVYKRSNDGGLTWSERLPTPASWATSKEVPTIHRVVDAAGKKRLIMWSGLYPARLAVSEDDGANWSELKPVGKWGGIVVMGFVEQLSKPGHYLAMFHDDGRFFTSKDSRRQPKLMTLYKTFSADGGLTWSFPEEIYHSSDVHLCEPGCIRSPDGKQMAVLLRENSRRRNSYVIFSDDEGQTWSEPRELPAALTGDRHTGVYAPDGRLFISFRDQTHVSPTRGDWVAWVGTYDDIVQGREGQYRLRLMDNHKGADCAYPGVLILPDRTIVTTTYGHWTPGEQPYIVSVRLKLKDLDALHRKQQREAAERKQARRTNVLLITSEDHGPHLSCYGDVNIRTPNLDELAAEGVRFANAYVTYSVCSPSRGSILTGLYPHQNGQIGLATHKFSMYRHWPNIASLLKGAGYRTGIIGKLHVNPAEAFPFDFKALSGSNFNDRPMQKFADLAGGFMRESDEPFFLMVNYPDAHYPLLRQQHGLPEEPISAADIKQMLPFVGIDTPRLRGHAADYYNCLKRLDTGIGLLLGQLEDCGKADDTLVVYLSDHGAQFSRGKTTSYEGGLRVPMMIRFPDRIQSPQTRKELVSSIDVLPTILEAVGLAQPDHLPGRSLLPLCRAEDVPWRRYVFTGKDGSTAFWAYPQRTVRDERFKLIHNLTPDRPCPTVESYEHHVGLFFVAGTTAEEVAAAPPAIQRVYATWKNPPEFELYDLQNDPHEFHNLAASAEHADVLARLQAELKRWQRSTGDPFLDPEKLARYMAETDGIAKRYGGREGRYRRDDAFRWHYHEYLAPAED